MPSTLKSAPPATRSTPASRRSSIPPVASRSSTRSSAPSAARLLPDRPTTLCERQPTGCLFHYWLTYAKPQHANRPQQTHARFPPRPLHWPPAPWYPPAAHRLGAG